MKTKLLKTLYIFICCLIILTKECYGYLDPSAMTYVIQIVAAVGIALATSFSIFFYKITKFFKKKKNKNAIEKDIDNV